MKKLNHITRHYTQSAMTTNRIKTQINILILILMVPIFLVPGNCFGNSEAVVGAVDLEQLNAYFEKARSDWKVPGMAVAIIKDGNVVLAKGYGVKEFGKKAKVDEKTLFAIASNTKAFTSASLAILVDEGKLKWDDKVRQYLPYFQLYDSYVSQEMTVRDLLCHRSGLKTFSGDLLWYETPYSTEEVIKRARFLKPAYGFRSRFGYSNIMFMAAGEVVKAITGKPWKEFVKERIFKPLNMTTTHIGSSELKHYDNVATPHYVYPDGKTVTVPYTSSDAVAGAAAIDANVADLALWLKMLLNKGKIGDKKIISENSLEEMWTSHISFKVTAGSKKYYPSTHFRSYGLGWGLADYLGVKVMSHGGGLDGMISRVALIPEKNLGIAIVTNSINGLPGPLMYKIIDSYMGAEPTDWSENSLKRMKKHAAEQKKKKQTKKSLPTFQVNLEDYTGKYGGQMYGNATVKLQNGKLVLNLIPAPIFISDLTPLHYDTFKLKLRNTFSFIAKGTGTVQFLRDKKGNVVEMKLDIPNRDFHFDELEFKRVK
jgi:CubicO group peptidase (beta-lactamase class C family)